MKPNTPDILGDILGHEPGQKAAEGHEKRRNIYLGDVLLKRAQAYAKRRHITLSAVIRMALEDFLTSEKA